MLEGIPRSQALLSIALEPLTCTTSLSDDAHAELRALIERVLEDHEVADPKCDILLFYKYARVADPPRLQRWQQALCASLGVTGRVRVASEGINGTVGGSLSALGVYVAAMKLHPDLHMSDNDFKGDLAGKERGQRAFPGLHVQICREIVTLGLDPDQLPPAPPHTHLSPAAFHALLTLYYQKKSSSNEEKTEICQKKTELPEGSSAPASEIRISSSNINSNDIESDFSTDPSITNTSTNTSASTTTSSITTSVVTNATPINMEIKTCPEDDVVLLDCRNDYESDVGSFRDAFRPPTRHFSDWPAFVREAVASPQLKLREKTVLMYCTGGIRCERGAQVLLAAGVSRVYQLQGGVHRYLQCFPDGGHFQGKLLVFDGRGSVPGGPQVVGQCVRCLAPWDDYSAQQRCVACRALLLLCDACLNHPTQNYDHDYNNNHNHIKTNINHYPNVSDANRSNSTSLCDTDCDPRSRSCGSHISSLHMHEGKAADNVHDLGAVADPSVATTKPVNSKSPKITSAGMLCRGCNRQELNKKQL
jgi:predicted sulfurtransferase